MIKAAVIGCGFIGQAHVEALRRLGDVEVASVAVSCKESAERVSKSLCVPAVTDYREILADESIISVHICTPNNLHYKMAEEALSAGKHVICEKPLAMNSEEGRRMCKLAEETGLVNAVCFNYRYYPMTAEARGLVLKGDIGRTFLVHGSYLQDWLLYRGDYNWRLDVGAGGRMRAVGDIGSHWADLVTRITGLVLETVCSDLGTFHKERLKPAGISPTFEKSKKSEAEPFPVETEDYGGVLVRFKGGARGIFYVSQVSAGRKNRLTFEIDGSLGSIAWNQERPEELFLGRRDGPNKVLLKSQELLSENAAKLAHYPGGHPEGYPDAFKNLFISVYSAIREGKHREDDYPTFRNGLNSLLLGEAILKSHETGGWEEVEQS
ncbi:MAG: Gfo/Idh/MocA family oxidoreductase [Chloroflexi bacterium]|nr:Gfo/Idh/MocA family oxidoreductase [Chloroflexota bacterium]